MTQIYSASYQSDLVGTITLASDGSSLVGLWLEGQKRFAAGYEGRLIVHESAKPFRCVRQWLDSYFAGVPLPLESLPLAPQGTVFQQLVWLELKTIPYGQTTTYGAIAKKLEEHTGRRCSARAVGAAVGRNPISIIIPCHRVVGANGSLTGYAGGIERKRALLEHEGIMIYDNAMPRFNPIPTDNHDLRTAIPSRK